MKNARTSPDLAELTRRIPSKYIERTPDGYGEYVNHGIVNQIILQTVGQFDWTLVEILRGHVPPSVTNRDSKNEKHHPALENAVVGAVYRLGMWVDDTYTTKDCPGSVDAQSFQTDDGERLKLAESDCMKRAGMRGGVALELWSRVNKKVVYFLPDVLEKHVADVEVTPADDLLVAGGMADVTWEPVSGDAPSVEPDPPQDSVTDVSPLTLVADSGDGDDVEYPPTVLPPRGVPVAAPPLTADQEVGLTDALRLMRNKPAIADKMDLHREWVNELGDAMCRAVLWPGEWPDRKAWMMRAFAADQALELDQSMGSGLSGLRRTELLSFAGKFHVAVQRDLAQHIAETVED